MHVQSKLKVELRIYFLFFLGREGGNFRISSNIVLCLNFYKEKKLQRPGFA